MELGKAYVQIVPSAEGIKGSIENVLGDEAEAAGASAGSKASGKFGKALSTGLKVAGAAATAIAGAASAAGVAIAKSAAETAAYGDNIDKMSQKLGISATAYQEWDAIMQHSGASIDSLTTSMKTMATAAETGNDAFAALGISEEEVATLSQEDLFARVISGLQDMEAGTERTYLAGQLLGRGATELGALLNTSSEDTELMRERVHKLGGVMSDEAVKAAAAYQDSLQDMQTSFAGIKRGLAQDMLPGMTTVMNGLTQVFSGNSGGAAAVKNGMNEIANSISSKIPVLKDLASSLLPVFRALLPTVVSIIGELAGTIAAELPALVTDVLPGLTEAAIQLALGLGQALATNAPSIIQTLCTAIVSNAPALLEGGFRLIVSLASGLIQAIPQLLIAAGQLLVVILEEIGKGVVQLADAGLNLVRGLWEGIKGAAAWLWQQISGWLGGLWDDIKGFFGIASPAKATTWAGEMLVEGLARGIDDAGDDAVAAAQRMNAGVLSAIGGDGFGANVTASSAIEIRHTGTIRVEGVNSAGELVAVTDILYDNIVERLRREARYA